MPKLGTLGVLLAAKEAGLIIESGHPEIEKLHELGFSLSQRVVESVLRSLESVSVEQGRSRLDSCRCLNLSGYDSGSTPKAEYSWRKLLITGLL
ncbi:MAG: DUF3368 domain-containing protein [bacterium]|nr:DUF3368 domain-containing protein [bacterium]